MPPRSNPEQTTSSSSIRQLSQQQTTAVQSPLWMAAALGELSTVQELLSAGRALVDEQDRNGLTPLHAACTQVGPSSPAVVAARGAGALLCCCCAYTGC